MGTGRPPGGPRDGPGSDEKLTDDFFFRRREWRARGAKNRSTIFFSSVGAASNPHGPASNENCSENHNEFIFRPEMVLSCRRGP